MVERKRLTSMIEDLGDGAGETGDLDDQMKRERPATWMNREDVRSLQQRVRPVIKISDDGTDKTSILDDRERLAISVVDDRVGETLKNSMIT